MAKSRQSFPNITSRFLSALDHGEDSSQKEKEVHHDDKKTIDGMAVSLQLIFLLIVNLIQ